MIIKLLASVIYWQAFKAMPETKEKRRRYYLATKFAKRY